MTTDPMLQVALTLESVAETLSDVMKATADHTPENRAIAAASVCKVFSDHFGQLSDTIRNEHGVTALGT